MQQALRRTGGNSAVAMINIIVESTVGTNEEVLMGCDQALEPRRPMAVNIEGERECVQE